MRVFGGFGHICVPVVALVVQMFWDLFVDGGSSGCADTVVYVLVSVESICPSVRLSVRSRRS